jgi:hypothetical protein
MSNSWDLIVLVHSTHESVSSDRGIGAVMHAAMRSVACVADVSHHIADPSNCPMEQGTCSAHSH